MVNDSVRVVLQARTSSKRLPGKALLPVGGMPLTLLAAKRAIRSGFDLVVATSISYYDNVLTETLESNKIKVCRGPLEDVLKRFVFATQDLKDTDICVRITGDNAFPDGDLICTLINRFQELAVPYLSTSDLFSTTPSFGISAEIFKIRYLREADKVVSELKDRKHVTSYFRKNLGSNSFETQSSTLGGVGGLRCSIDTLEDYVNIASFFLTVKEPVETLWSKLLEDFYLYLKMNPRLDT